MKKKFFAVVLIAVMAVAAGWNFKQSQNKVELSDLALANVEALANPETDPIYPGWENRDCYNEWVGGMDGYMNRVCKCSTPGYTYLFCM